MVLALICGGGNGAHVLAGIASSQPGVEARVLTLFADEAERWTNTMKDNELVLKIHGKEGEPTYIKAKPSMVTKDAAKGTPGCDIIIFTVPAFAHAGYLEALKPHVKPGTILVGCPGNAGFEFAVRGIWGDLAKQCTIMSFESLPWACRITSFGKGAEVLGTKGTLLGAVQIGEPKPSQDPTFMLQSVLGKLPVLTTTGHLLGITLMGTNGYLHPSIMYGNWHKWDKKPLNEPPLFYNGLDEFSADTLSAISDEIIAIARGIMQQRPNVDLSNVQHIYQWYLRCYGGDISDNTNLYTCIRTNKAYKGLTHPCKKGDDGKFSPDFTYRYMTEDIPFGLAVMKGIANIAGVQTPNMDKVISWAQSCMDKVYLQDGQIKGIDMPSSRAPQAYGINDLDVMLGLK